MKYFSYGVSTGLVWPTYANLQLLRVSLYIPLLMYYGVLLSVFGFMSWEILFLHLNAMFTLVYLKMFVIFLICGDT